MSETTTVSEPKARTVTLHNGTVFSFNSNTSTSLEKIPVIDASGIWSDELEDRMAVAQEIREASRNIGFFYLINHGIDQNLADITMAEAKRFFDLPVEKKMEVFTGLVPNEYVGFHPMECYNRNGWKHQDLSEAFNWAYDAEKDPEAVDKTEKSVSIWPTDLPGFRDNLYAYHTELLRLSRRLTRIFALALHLPEDYFDKYVKRPEAGMRILHYPEQKHSVDEQNGIGAHTDVECFTIVTQDSSGGLEVLSKSGNWVKADPMPGSFVVNIADCFMRQTNDFFVSTIHRVINKSGKERYSAPFFFGFDREKVLEPVPTCVSEENPMKYPVMTGGEYYAWRTNRQKKTSTVTSKGEQ
ncbi:2OG-Fe(II)oxygenase superfamily protein [Colletotrichum orchidophilum]|uniref:2OG-Fe(II)oxygenase superfamily protein n=1 Tax=Colletotrichum orchidophilum TaxID=1209926 RepID=A0A1G4BQN3_9PEZI|nr:2OG-Fe(II)oxygenase superfamily protein [Colletotrichum orchidophilum]OHF03597.1 2OG-Fe(II)oxygenase superfamily protein [Colletotrichum orchidophilum]